MKKMRMNNYEKKNCHTDEVVQAANNEIRP